MDRIIYSGDFGHRYLTSLEKVFLDSLLGHERAPEEVQEYFKRRREAPQKILHGF